MHFIIYVTATCNLDFDDKFCNSSAKGTKEVCFSSKKVYNNSCSDISSLFDKSKQTMSCRRIVTATRQSVVPSHDNAIVKIENSECPCALTTCRHHKLGPLASFLAVSIKL